MPPLDYVTEYEGRALLRAVAELRQVGQAVTLTAVAGVSGLPLDLLERLEDDHWDADVPALRRQLRRLQERRAVRLLAEALARAADDEAADLAAVVGRVRELLAALQVAG